MKKTLAILLSLALVICMIPGSAFADTDPVSLSGATVTAADVIYNGAAQQPAVTVVLDGKTLVSGTDYDVAYTANTDAGEATVTVTGKGAYKDSATGKFTIKKFDLTANAVSASVDNQTNVTPGEVTSIAGADYLHFYKGAVEDASLKTLLNGKIKVTISQVGTTAQYKAVFTLIDTDNLEGFISDAVFYKVADISSAKVVPAYGLTVSTDGTTINAGAYNGAIKTISSLFTLQTADNKVINSSNYTVTAIGPDGKTTTTAKDAGLYTITVVGINDYASTKTIYLNIGQRDASVDAKLVRVDAIYGQYSTSQFSDIVPTVRDNSLGVLTAGTDYTYRVDSGVVTITFKGNYIGTQAVTFSVVESAKDIAQIYGNLDIKVAGEAITGSAHYVASKMYNGYFQAPTITVGKLSSSYYAIEYRYFDDKGVEKVVTNPKDAEIYSIYLVGKNGYGGEKLLGTLSIQPFYISWVELTAAQGSSADSPIVSVKSFDGTVVFEKDKDYKITKASINKYTNTGKVTISTMGNLEEGTLEAEYTVVGKSLAYCTAEFAAGSKQYNEYTGYSIKPSVRVRDGYTVLTLGSDYTVAYKDADGVEVSLPKDAGTYTIEITGKGAYAGTLRLTYYITGKDISHYTVNLSKDSAAVTGYAQSPTVVSVKYGTTVLRASDYEVTYQDATGKTVTSMKTPGTYKVVVSGVGGYSGSTYATFRIIGEPQEISIAKTSYKVYKDSDSFKISAKATGDGTGFSYVSSDPTVASVSSTGVVTIHKIGRAKITVTTTGMKKSDPAFDEVFVKVYPDKTTISKKPWTEGKKGSLRVRWDIQEDATYYEVRYSRDKSFKKGTYKTKKVTASEKYDTQSTALKDLYSGKTYYVKVRAVKVVYNDFGEELKYYGKWSNWRSAKTK